MVFCLFYLFHKCFESILPRILDVKEVDRRKKPEKRIDIPFAGAGNIEMQLWIKGSKKSNMDPLNSLPDQHGGEALFEGRVLNIYSVKRFDKHPSQVIKKVARES